MKSRYRFEDGRPCIDVRLPSLETMFDTRDPSPFRERDLDVGLFVYLKEGVEDLLGKKPRLVFWLEQDVDVNSLRDSVRGYVAYELEALQRRRSREVRFGLIGLSIAVLAIAALMSLSTVIRDVLPGHVGDVIKEALVISGWVLLWRPVESLVFDALPHRQERRVLTELLVAPLEVRRVSAAVVTQSPP